MTSISLHSSVQPPKRERRENRTPQPVMKPLTCRDGNQPWLQSPAATSEQKYLRWLRAHSNPLSPNPQCSPDRKWSPLKTRNDSEQRQDQIQVFNQYQWSHTFFHSKWKLEKKNISGKKGKNKLVCYILFYLLWQLVFLLLLQCYFSPNVFVQGRGSLMCCCYCLNAINSDYYFIPH